MARIPAVERREDLAPEHRAAYDEIAASRRRVAGPFAMLLHSPEVARRAAHLGAYIRFEATLDGKVRELAVLAAAREMDCRYEWAAHAAEARRAGVREEAIAAIGSRAPALSDDERPVVSYVQQLLREHRVDEPTFQALRARFGVQGLVELTATAGYYGMIACVLNAFDVTPPPGADVLPERA